MPAESSLAHSYPAPRRVKDRPGPSSAGQSGDTQGLPDTADLSDQSVAELVEEGQAFEAEVLLGVENAAKQIETEVHTNEVPEDDVPAEYQDVAEPPRSQKSS